MGLRLRTLALLISFLFLGALVSGTILGTTQSMQPDNSVVIYSLSGQVTGVTTLAIQEMLSLADTTNARLVLIELSTTGGELGAVSQIMQMFATSPVPVLVYIPPAAQALSGGTYLLMASHIAAMGPTARMGSCQPILGFLPVSDPTYLSSLVELMTYHARLHERNVTSAGRFILENLNLGPVEAQGLGSIELIANSRSTLLNALESYTLVERELLPGEFTYRLLPTASLGSYNYSQIIQDFSGISAAPLFFYNPNPTLTLLAFIAHPVVTFILLQIGIWGFIFALNAPGHMGEIISVICIILALVGLGIIGISVAGIILMILGLGMIIIEAKTDIGFAGLAGIIGVVCFVLGGIFFIPPNQWLIPTQIMWLFQGISAGTALIFSALFGYAVIKAAEARRLTSDFDPKIISGARGVAETILDPEGRVRALGESWTAIAEEGIIKAGEEVEVIRLDGIRLVVKKSEPADEFQ